MEAENVFANSRVNTRHVGAVIGSTKCRDEDVKDLVKDFDNQLTILSIIAEIQPQAVYSAFASAAKLMKCYTVRYIKIGIPKCYLSDSPKTRTSP